MSTRIRSVVSKIQRCGQINAKTAFLRQQQPTTQLVHRTYPFMPSYRALSTSNNQKSNSKSPNETKPKDEPEDESHLNWKDRKEAPKWMQRIAPTKGGKWPPSPQEAVILSAGLAVFVWSWTAA